MNLAKTLLTTTFSVALAGMAVASGGDDHSHDEPSADEMLESMIDMHSDHEHAHDFEAMDDISEDDMHRTMDFLMEIGLVVPTMDSTRGAETFFDKGCVVCHSVNGVGGEVGPSFNADDMPQPMNAFEFAARMWRGAPAMVLMQENLMGEMIDLTGQELADIVAFVHDAHAQEHVSAADIPEAYRDLIP
jgi:cytochrome c551/c552